MGDFADDLIYSSMMDNYECNDKQMCSCCGEVVSSNELTYNKQMKCNCCEDCNR